jgi:hypothetical protein
MELDLWKYKEKQAYFKNKYFWQLKIVINSPNVHFGIKDNMHRFVTKI